MNQPPKANGNLILVLGDQLNEKISSLARANRQMDTVLMVEVASEATYVNHHKKKIAFLFSAMRHFAEQLRNKGWHVTYVTLNDPDNSGTITSEIARTLSDGVECKVYLTEPGEHRLKSAILEWAVQSGHAVELLEDDRFVASHAEFRSWADGRKQLRMEYFYRDMRRKTGLLMSGDNPEGGQWNFDAENRKPTKSDLFMPSPSRTEPDSITEEVLDLVKANFPDHFGDLEPFWFAVTREGALEALDNFIEHALPSFGDYQDAMLENESFMYHSVLAQYLNAGLLAPLEICRRVEAAYYSGDVPLNAAEGYIRQIIGWREYVRGIYWLKMPTYTDANFLEATRPLPAFYWTGDTDLACLAAAISQTKREAYAHHIQRLMVTGNFALLVGVNPHALHEWYLAVYADAYEWVEAPNTIGMSQFADGGFLGSKPYAASGNYINKMSNYCGNCRYDVKQKAGPDACPFNALYWDFLIRNQNKLGGNARLRQVFSTWDKMDEAKKKSYRDSAGRFLNDL